MNTSNCNTENLALTSWVWIDSAEVSIETEPIATKVQDSNRLKDFSPTKSDILAPLRQWLDNVQVQDAKLAHRICQLVPAQCPFERDIKFLGRTLIHIPPLCKLNPVYDQVVALRFRALCYLADVCGEDISAYC